MSETDAPTTDIDSYAAWRWLRKNAPVQRMAGEGVMAGPWQVARHADAHAVLRDFDTFSSDVAVNRQEDRGPSMLFSDPPIHNRLRKLVSRAFKPSHIESQREMIMKRCNELLDDLGDSGEVDLVDAFAAPLPVAVIAKMLGVEDGDMRQFKIWSDTIFSNIGEILLASPSPEAEQASAEMDAYFLERIDALRQSPAEHLLGRLVETETDEGMLTNEELLMFCRLLLIAGNETTTGLISASVRVFNEFPETFEQLRQRPELAPTFVEEALRYYSPFSATIRRTTRDVEIGGVQIAKGELVLPMIASANRDETVFDSPDEFRIERDPNPHLAFGFGIHFCLGAHLARLEGQIAAVAMAQRFSSITVLPQDDDGSGSLGGPKTLLVRYQRR